jgi:hypothetical protein
MTISDLKAWEQERLEKKGWKTIADGSYSMTFIKQGGMISVETDKKNLVLIQLSFSTKEKTYNNIRKYFN